MRTPKIRLHFKGWIDVMRVEDAEMVEEAMDHFLRVRVPFYRSWKSDEVINLGGFNLETNKEEL